MSLSWIPYVVAMLRSPVVLGMLRDLFELTRGSVRESEAAIRRMKDRGYVLKEAEDDVDARLDAVDRKGQA